MTKKKGENNNKPIKKVQNLSVQKRTKTLQTNKVQKSRAKYECPKKISEMIFAANLLPKNFHFDLMETAKEKLKQYEFLLKDDTENNGAYLIRNDAEFDKYVDDVLNRSTAKVARIEAWNKIAKQCNNHKLNWLEFYFSLPEKVIEFLQSSKEVEHFKKSDSYEYWLNKEDEAWEFLDELHNGNEITDEEYELVQGNGKVASFLIEKGYYGSHLSYQNRERDEDDDDEDDDDEYKDIDDFSWSMAFAEYVAYTKLEESRDLIIGLAEVSESLSHTEDSIRSKFENHLPKTLVEKIHATTVKIENEGKIHFSISELAEAIQGVDIYRIRRCEICGKVFWANRKDAFACSKQHAKTRQMRLLRANWNEKGDLYLKERKKKQTKKESK